MKIQDFTNMKEFEKIMSNWAQSTGMATVAVGADGNYISDCYNFTDFCIKYTRGSKEGRARCEKCDREGKGVYHCHAGLLDFGVDLVVDGVKLGAVIGGQVLPSEPEEDKFRKVAHEIGVSEEVYIEALHKVKIRNESVINASAGLLGQVLNNYINAEYAKYKNETIIEKLTKGAKDITSLVDDIQRRTDDLRSIQQKQKMLALNASIEAARASELGKGFAVVASEVGKLSEISSKTNTEIEKILTNIIDVVTAMNK